ncbi:hypothetical protein [Streptomyces sp. STR69]|uniref:hypothetical protein n=1 Tax=Streptomyces sp. STR69 TaxID=1796942 RepID=UPI0021C6B655|nr:hypothetical protein [Streptomyces sp. STR69]
MSGLLPGRAGETRLALALLTVTIAHFATAVAFGHSVAGALESLAEDLVMLVAVVATVAWVRSRMRRRRPQAG